MKRLLRKAALFTLVALAALSVAAAGEIYGKITDGAKPVEGASVTVKCGGETAGPATTDKTGGYHVVAKATGKCTLTVSVKGQSASIDVASYEDGAQVDLVLETKDGKPSLRRK